MIETFLKLVTIACFTILFIGGAKVVGSRIGNALGDNPRLQPISISPKTSKDGTLEVRDAYHNLDTGHYIAHIVEKDTGKRVTMGIGNTKEELEEYITWLLEFRSKHHY